jgi:hypothetical protein
VVISVDTVGVCMEGGGKWKVGFVVVDMGCIGVDRSV